VELKQLRYLLAVADHRSFSKAAETVGVTQQALSHSIAQLERELQARLFVRTQAGAEPTEIGRALVKRARMIAAESDLAEREVQVLRSGQRGNVRFGVGSTIVQQLLPMIVRRFSTSRPKFSLTLRVDLASRLYESLLSGEIDVALTAPGASVLDVGDGELHHEVLDGLEFDANFLVMRADHPLLALPSPTLRDVVAYPWIMPETMTDFVRNLFDLFAREGVAPPGYVLRTDSFWGAGALVHETDFVVWIGRHVYKTEIDAGRLGGLPLPGVTSTRRIVLSHRTRSPLQPAAAALVEVFREVVRGSR
jgi:DNA-binding transcriptional LysR family regulator